MRPDYSGAIVDLIKHYGWKKVIFIYDTHDGMCFSPNFCLAFLTHHHNMYYRLPSNIPRKSHKLFHSVFSYSHYMRIKSCLCIKYFISTLHKYYFLLFTKKEPCTQDTHAFFLMFLLQYLYQSLFLCVYRVCALSMRLTIRKKQMYTQCIKESRLKFII